MNKYNVSISDFNLDKLSGDKKFKISHIKRLIKAGYNKNTIDTVITVFNNIAFYEDEIYNRDVYDFNLEQTKVCLKGLARRSLQHLCSEKTMLYKYCLDAVDSKISIHNVHGIEFLGRKQIAELVCDAGIYNSYISRTEMYDIVEDLDNWSDKALFILLFKGVVDKGYSAIRSITREDIDLDKKVLNWTKLKRDGSVVQCTTALSDYEVDILIKSSEETEYRMYDIDTEKTILKKFSKSSYILKPFVGRRNTSNCISNANVLNARFHSSCFKIGWKYLKPRKVIISSVVCDMLDKKESWIQKEIISYINTNDLEITHYTLSDAIRIMKKKLNELDNVS